MEACNGSLHSVMNGLLICAATALAGSLLEQSLGLETGVYHFEAGCGGEFSTDDKFRIRFDKIYILIYLEEHGSFQGLLGEPEGIDIFGSFQHLVSSRTLRSHKFQDAQHGHAVIAVREQCMIIAAGTVDLGSNLFHKFLLFRGEGDHIQAGI